jgi:hypothetical protein
LVNRSHIVVDGLMMRRVDGRELDVGVFAALVALERCGYLQRGGGVNDRESFAGRCYVRLTVAGIQLLSWLNLEAGRAELALGA